MIHLILTIFYSVRRSRRSGGGARRRGGAVAASAPESHIKIWLRRRIVFRCSGGASGRRLRGAAARRRWRLHRTGTSSPMSYTSSYIFSDQSFEFQFDRSADSDPGGHESSTATRHPLIIRCRVRDILCLCVLSRAVILWCESSCRRILTSPLHLGLAAGDVTRGSRPRVAVTLTG